MQNKVIEKTESTPGVILNKDTGLIELYGESRPEHAKLFFAPILNWIDEYGKYLATTEKKRIHLHFKMEYFNSSSARFFVEIISAVNEVALDNKGTACHINWYYEKGDEDLLAAGKELKEVTGAPVNCVMY